jgi:hypothetical protein
VLVAPSTDFLRVCLLILRQAEEPLRVEVVELENVASLVARHRPAALIVPEDILALDPHEFDALARDVSAEVIPVDTAKDPDAISATLLPRLKGALLRWEVRDYVLR